MKKQTQKTTMTVFVRSDLAVVGYNPENADLDYPNGEIVREVFYLVAEDARGNRWQWGSFSSERVAEAAYLTLAPPVFLWEATRPAYGSEAYVEHGQADDLAWEKAQESRR